MKWTGVAFHALNLTFWISGLRISLGPFSNLSMFIALEVRKGGRKGKERVEEVALKQNKKREKDKDLPITMGVTGRHPQEHC
ncbi:hypothetical protein EYF80_021608 [Liparis tanakae]|uniref:Uncharacterized protein n=1 Tax=Liparis tanakae TaxID=230148 RepID=A0A4Z2HS44_9TELE|nr:hypothetical protein EYF80_021608 [Liparis tanakae]